MAMNSDDFICNTEVIPDTHCFVYRNRKYPIKYDFFKYSSKYFQDHQEEIQNNPNIQLTDDKLSSNYELTDDTITDFIKFVQCSQIKLTRENVVGLNYLSTKYEISTLKKHTEDYIKKNHQIFVVELLQKSETDTNFDRENCEEIISSHLEEYIHDERLSNLTIPTLYRIVAKYHQKKSKTQTSKEIIDFLFKILGKYGREASVLFSEIDFGDAKIEIIKRLLTDFSSDFDFHFINSTLLQTLYDTNGEIMRREEQHQIEMEKMKDEIKRIDEKYQNEIKRIEESHRDEIRMQKEETQKLVSDVKNDLMKEISKLREELKSQREMSDMIQSELRPLSVQLKTLQADFNVANFNVKKLTKAEEGRERREKEEGTPHLLKENEEFNGIIKYLTDVTKGNIHDNGTIEVTTSSNDSSSKNILDFNCNSCYEADDSDDEWICFDFKKRKVKITDYSIKSYQSGKDGHHLKSWIIEISNDGRTWQTIDEHRDCPTLNGSCITGTFSVKPNNYSRYVRLHQTGEPWGGHYLWFHYIEFYGYLSE